MTTRKQAAEQLHSLYNSYELRPVSFKTIYNRVYFRNGAWHLTGKAHDYTV